MSATLFQDYSHYDSPQYFNSNSDRRTNDDKSAPYSPEQSKLNQQQSTNSNNNPLLPKWLSDYFDWHISMRKQFPGESILTHPDSPGVLIKSCAYKCGGLHDRLGGLGWDLYLANQTRRVFMIHWCIPAPIEHYLVPNIVDWTVPYNESSSILDERLFSNTTEQHIHCDRAVGDWHGLFDGYVEYMQGEDFFERNVDLALDRAIHGNYSKIKILRYKVLGVDQRLEQRLLMRHNETDPIAWSDAFPAMFWTLFKPSVGLQKELDETFRYMKISTPWDYNAPPFILCITCKDTSSTWSYRTRSIGKNKGQSRQDGVTMGWCNETICNKHCSTCIGMCAEETFGTACTAFTKLCILCRLGRSGKVYGNRTRTRWR